MSSSTFIKCVYGLFIYLCFAQTTYSQNVGSQCKMKSGKPGMCVISIDDCRDLWAIIDEGGVTNCGVPNNNMMCCPSEQFSPTVKVETPCTLQSGRPGLCKSKELCEFQGLQREGNTECGSAGNNMICCPNKQSISSQKCMEYNQIKNCRDENELLAVHTIYHGDIVSRIEEYPHMAFLGYNSSTGIIWACGGTLISEQFVLTAAHCLNYERSLAVSHVHLGILNRSNRNVNTLQEFRVVGKIKYPKPTARYAYSDIALLKLDRPVTFTNAVFPACLHDEFKISVSSLETLGWGETESSSASEELRKAKLVLHNYTVCSEAFKKDGYKFPSGIIDESQFCAGGNNKDACNGDSGGPTVTRHSNGCMNSLVGIASMGFKCERSKGMTSGVYTRVSFYLPWIEGIVWPNST